MEEEWDTNENQGRSKEHVERNNFIFILISIFASLFGLVMILYTLFNEIF
jgi:hypothetical protein